MLFAQAQKSELDFFEDIFCAHPVCRVVNKQRCCMAAFYLLLSEGHYPDLVVAVS